MARAKKALKDETSLIEKMAAKLESLEKQLKERDEKAAKAPIVSEPGFQKFGQSPWKSLESGSEKGYYKSFYVDVRQMIAPRPM